MELYSGYIIDSGNFELKSKITSLDEFWKVLNSETSIYARHRMYPTAFFRSWPLSLIHNWMIAGRFWTAKKV